MARFCTGCGSELREGVAFCTECGAKAGQPVNQQPPAFQSIPQRVPQPAAQYTPQPVAQPVPQYAPQPAAENPNKVVSTGAFFGMMLLFALPVIGWIACVIMAFAPKNENIRHFARANLIWLIIALLIAGLLSLAVSALVEFVTPYIEQINAGDFGALGEYGEIFEQFGDLKDILAGLETQPAE